jgi:long-subunit fatty acid transport protein
MKKYILLSILGLGLTSQAQDMSDALRFAQTNINGTARYRAMGGAFTALGGDLSSIALNPASSSVFHNNQFGVTLGTFNVKNESNYFGTTAKKTELAFDLSQLGAVFVFQNDDEESDWKKLSLGISYDNQGSFANNSLSKGINTSSIDRYFLAQADGVRLDLLQTLPGESIGSLYTYLGENYDNRYQTALLGYQSYILEATNNNPNNASYYSNVPAGSFEHYNYLTESGYNSKLAFNISTQYSDKFYFGMNLNLHAVDYTRTQTFYELNDNAANTDGETVREIHYQTDLYTYGTGFSFQLGAIAKVTPEFRLGFSYESPTWYRLNDELTQRISTRRVDLANPNGALNNFYFNDNILNIFPVYKLQTPGKYSFGGAYVFGSRGLISVDYALKDYSSTMFRPKNNRYYSDQNDIMEDVLDLTSEVRIGAEIKEKKWSFRGGYNYEQSPFKNGKTIGDLQQFSFGIGHNFGSTKLDLAYSRAQREYNQPTFNAGLTDAAKIEKTTSNIFLTLLFEF